jgi:hypothetical protein
VRVVVGGIIPLALVVTISPLNIIPAILLLFTARPLANALSFLGGFIAGIGVVLAVFVSIAGALDRSAHTGQATWVAVLKLVLGAYLVVAAVRRFRSRPTSGAPGTMPGWMDGIAGYSPGRSLGLGLALGGLNPKNMVVGAAAAASIGSAALSGVQQVGVGAIYVAVAVLGVAAPILVTVFLGHRSSGVLDSWQEWLKQNNATVLSVLFVVFGVVLIGQGIAGI